MSESGDDPIFVCGGRREQNVIIGEEERRRTTTTTNVEYEEKADASHK